MPNPPKPLVPNITTGAYTGRVATDVYDFRNHTDGYAFRHKASQIDLFPTVVIGSEVTNVQDAIVALKNALTIPVLPDATSTVKGALKLTNDLGGTADLPSVVALRGFPVAATPPTLNYVLTWLGSSWGPASVGASFTLSGDVTGAVAANTVSRIQGRPVSSTAPLTNDGLVWNGSQWAPSRTVPSGTGFASVTSGSFDTNATANIRYTGGKFQTDTSIQFKNSSILGDVVWSPTGSNKTITLPDATDTLIGRNTSDILTNKNINATNNTITDTGTAAGDVLVSNGTKFVRLAKGANGSFLGVSAGTVGYYTPSGSAVGGTGFVHSTNGTFDANATANIRYTGGKFQTDVAVQYLNGSITGDLEWIPTSTNKTLTLPDATDTLVGKATVDIFTNKTFNVSGTGNALTATSQAVGDLLKNNGSSFVRFGMGSALQVLRVNAAGTDLEWANSTGGASAGSSGEIQTSNGSGGFLAATNVRGGSGFMSVGADPATTGQIRFTGATSTRLIDYRYSGNNYALAGIASDNKLTFGDTSYPNGLQIQSSLVSIYSSSFPITLFGGGNLSLTASASDVKFALPVGGDSGANKPFCWKRTTLAGAASQTLSASSYENVIIEVSSTGDGQTVILPLVVGAFFIAKNTGSGANLLFKASTGTGVTVNGGESKMIYCDGTNYVLATS